jgi:hypothetical protein
MIRPFEIAAVATLALLMSTVPTFAQLEGTWQCEMTYTELTPQGQRTSGYIKQYIMGVYAGGGLEVQGSYTGIGGLTQFQVQGQWKIDQGHFMAQAQGMQQSQAARPVRQLCHESTTLCVSARLTFYSRSLRLKPWPACAIS